MADYPRSWNDDHPPVIRREIRIDIDRLVEGAKLLPLAGFWIYVVIAFLLQGGCLADDPDSGLDIPAGCQCAGALEELDRRLRAVEGRAQEGTFVPPEWLDIVPEGAEMEVKAVFAGGEWFLTWWITYATNYERFSYFPETKSFAIPYPTTSGTAHLWTRTASGYDVEWSRAPWRVYGGDSDPLVDVILSGEEVEVVGTGWTFRMVLPPIPTSAMVTE